MLGLELFKGFKELVVLIDTDVSMTVVVSSLADEADTRIIYRRRDLITLYSYEFVRGFEITEIVDKKNSEDILSLFSMMLLRSF